MKLAEKDGSVRIPVHAKPRAKKSRIVRDRGVLAAVLKVPRRDIELVRGDASREKLVAVVGLTVAEVEARIEAAVVASSGR
jgi:uncharacterized protein YggU (UPF0235/DUF167 family)